jgi:diadenosine tetraphosphate (Ap4A) HIT family hydrolase
MSDGVGCLACDLTAGRLPLPGGAILRTEHWVVEHCVGPLGVGTLIVKPLRHVLRFADLTPNETADFGPLVQRVSAAVLAETGADQTYICQWSHAGFEAGHIHFVVQPAWDSQRGQYARPGPFLQAAMFEENTPLDEARVVAFCDGMRARLATEVLA